MFLDLVLGGIVPSNFSTLCLDAKRVFEANYSALQLEQNSIRQEAKNLAHAQYQQNLAEMGITEDKYKEQIKNKYLSYSDYLRELRKTLFSFGYSIADVNIALKYITNIDDAVSMHLGAIRVDLFQKAIEYNYPGINCIEDIICSIYKGKQIIINQQAIELKHGHSEQYYNQQSNNQFHEIIANYVVLRMTQDYESIQLLETCVGEQFVQELENTFQTMLIHTPPFWNVLSRFYGNV
jgi:two-component sensor histidine kinase